MSSTCSKRPNPDMPSDAPAAKVQVCGGADSEFSSALVIAEDHLDKFWKGWRTEKVFLVPSIFKWKNPDISDAAINSLSSTLVKDGSQEFNRANRPIIDDKSFMAEYTIFQEFERLTHDQIGHPIMGVHSLEISIDAKRDISKIFPNSEEVRQLIHIQLNKFNTSGTSTSSEFDFVIVGQEIGIIIIEVKSSGFSKGRDFNSIRKNLPDHISKGLQQLSKADIIAQIFHNCMPEDLHEKLPVRTILFLPNLEKERYDSWLANLADVDFEAYERVLSMEGETVVWFKEDMAQISPSQLNPQDPPLYGKIFELLKPATYTTMSQIAYETCVKVLLAIKSMTRPRKNEKMELDLKRLSPLTAILEEDNCIRKEIPLSNLKTPDKQLKTKVYFLTKEQLDVLFGANRQIIVGSAGTGKTVVIQEKILELIQRGQRVQRVLILAPEGTQFEYGEFLRKFGYQEGKNYIMPTVQSCADMIYNKFRHDGIARLLQRAFKDKEYAVLASSIRLIMSEHRQSEDVSVAFKKIVEKARSLILKESGNKLMEALYEIAASAALNGNLSDLLRWIPAQDERTELTIQGAGNDLEILCSFFRRVSTLPEFVNYFKDAIPGLQDSDHIFIDDLLDEDNWPFRYPHQYIVGIVIFMEAFRAINANMVVWAAFDPYKGRTKDYPMSFVANGFFQKISRALQNVRYGKDELDRFSIVALKQVMRCSKKIFDECYKLDEKWDVELQPEAGHKILGMRPVTKQGQFANKEEAMENLWQEIKRAVHHLIDFGCRYDHFAIILSNEGKGDQSLINFISERCSQMEAENTQQMEIEIPEQMETGTSQGMESKNPQVDWLEVKKRLRSWNSVSSMEWPIVIYGSVLVSSCGVPSGKANPFRDPIYQRYRGQTRAKVFLMSYDFTYAEDMELD